MPTGSPRPRAWKSAAATSTIQSFRLVDGERRRLAGLADLAGDEVVLGREARPPVHQQNEPIGFGHRALRLGAHLGLDALRVLDQTAGIDDHERQRSQAPEAVLPIPGESGHVRHDCVARAGEHVEQGRFADVGPTYESDDGQHGMLLVLLLGDIRYALMRPSSLMTTTSSPSAMGGLLMRSLPLRTRAMNAPVCLSRK